MGEIKDNPLQYRLGGEFDSVKSKITINQNVDITTKPSSSSKGPKPISEKNDWLKDEPLPGEISHITHLCMRLGIEEPLEELVTNRLEARNIIGRLEAQVKAAKKSKSLRQK